MGDKAPQTSEKQLWELWDEKGGFGPFEFELKH